MSLRNVRAAQERLWFIVTVTLALAVSDVSRAEAPFIGLPATRAWLDVAAFRGPQPVGWPSGSVTQLGTTTVISPSLGGRALVDERWLFHATIPFVSAVLSEFPQFNSFRIGNPTVDASYVFKFGLRTWLACGIGVGFPFATAPIQTTTDDGAGLALLVGRVLRGGTAAWEFTPHQLTLYFPFEIETGTQALRIGAETTFSYGIATSSGFSQSRGTRSPFVIGARVQALIAAGVWLGTRLNLARLDSLDVPEVMPQLPNGITYSSSVDLAQFSAEPFAELRLERMFVQLGARINLDPPYGFGSDYITVWSARFSAGALF